MGYNVRNLSRNCLILKKNKIFSSLQILVKFQMLLKNTYPLRISNNYLHVTNLYAIRDIYPFSASISIPIQKQNV